MPNPKDIKVFAEARPLSPKRDWLKYERGSLASDIAKALDPKNAKSLGLQIETVLNRDPNRSLSDLLKSLNIKTKGAQQQQIVKNKFKQLQDIQNELQNLGEPSVRDSAFIKEAQNIKQFYQDNPNANVDIIPLYENRKKIEESLEGLSEEDRMVLMGHSGSKLAGIPNVEWAEQIRQSDVGECYLGTCGFEEYSEPFDIEGKDVYMRPQGAWWGFSPQAESFKKGMYGRQTVESEGEAAMRPLEKGESYQKLQEGGNKSGGGGNQSSGAIYGMAGQMGSSIFDQLATQYDEETTQNIGMDVASGVASGAAMGSAISPGIGTAAGALVGGITSYIGAQNEKEKAQEMEEKRQYLQNLKQFKQKQANRSTVDYQPVFEKGGKMLEEFKGPKHENGGIDINVAEVEGGETEFDPMDYIFSDTLKDPDSKKTFAEVSKKIKNKYGDRDNRFVNEAKRRELKDLMQKQEKKKSKSSKNKEKKQEGGFLQGKSTGLDILSLTPSALTVGMTLGDVLSEPVDPELPRMEGQAYDPQFIDYRPRFREIEKTFDAKSGALTRGARTPGQFMAGQIQSATQEARAKSDAMQKIQEANRQQRARAEYMNYQQRLQNMQQATQEEKLAMQAESQRRNAIRQGISALGTQAGQIASDIRKQRAQKKSREQYMDILRSMYPDVETTDEGIQMDLQSPYQQGEMSIDQWLEEPLNEINLQDNQLSKTYNWNME